MPVTQNCKFFTQQVIMTLINSILLSGGEHTVADVFLAVCGGGVAFAGADAAACFPAAEACCCCCCEACWTGEVVADPGFPGSAFILAGNTFGRVTPCNFLRTRWIAMENSSWSILPSALMSARFLQIQQTAHPAWKRFQIHSAH